MFKIIHTADIHLGRRAFNYTYNGLNAREFEIYLGWWFFLQRVREINPALLIIAGDLYDGKFPPVAAILASLWLGDLDIPVLIVEGNHDQTNATSPSPLNILRIFPNVHVFSDPGYYIMPNGGLKIFLAPPDTEEYKPADILVAHDKFIGPKEYHYAHPRTLQPENYKYVALGDLHRYCEIAYNAIYPGPLDTFAHASEKETYSEARGFMEVDVDTHPKPIVKKFHEMYPRAYRTFEITKLEDIEAILPLALHAVCRIFVEGDLDVSKYFKDIAWHVQTFRRRSPGSTVKPSEAPQSKTLQDSLVEYCHKIGTSEDIMKEAVKTLKEINDKRS
jgi:DNA repair exonuclease SbcCD nuclease subunit